MSATFNSVGKLDVNKVLLSSSAKVSEPLSLLVLKIFGGTFPNLLAFFVLRFLNSFSISDKEASLKENNAGFLILSLIKRILRRFLYFEMALFTGSGNSLVSMRYEFYRIFKVLKAFLKN